VDSEELVGITAYLTLYTRCRISDVVITVFDCTCQVFILWQTVGSPNSVPEVSSAVGCGTDFLEE